MNEKKCEVCDCYSVAEFCCMACMRVHFEAEIKSSQAKVENFTNNLKNQLDFASISSARRDFNDATRKYWRVKAEVYGELLTELTAP